MSMSSSINPQDQTLDHQPFNQNPNDHSKNVVQEWEAIALAWLSNLPEGKTVTTNEVESWLACNQASLPEQLKSIPQQELCERIASMQKSIESPNEEKDANLIDNSQARFQRTDQWMPVYSWLESLDSNEAVKSQDILDWLTENPEVREQLYSRHSRYHLMHYIKKCHVKILKRKQKKTGLQVINKGNPAKVHKNEGKKLPNLLPCNNFSDLPKDSDAYLSKQKEASRKYEILVELEKQLSVVFPKHENVNKLES